MKYNPWPLGQVPLHLQRTELLQLAGAGYSWDDDAREVINIFERKVAKFSGAKYGVAVDSCTHALELCFMYLILKGELTPKSMVFMPTHTYVSAFFVPNQLGVNVAFIPPEEPEAQWSGIYPYLGCRIYDGAVRWQKDMYVKHGKDKPALQCLSFQIKKRIPIGRGGMILTDDVEAVEWLRLARYDGRDMELPYDDPNHIRFKGWHYYMTPEDAARGILLMDQITEEGDTGGWENYPDITNYLKL